MSRKMTPKSIEARVAMIATMGGDPESSHSSEDTLWQEVLESIRDGKVEDPAACAAAALKTNEPRPHKGGDWDDSESAAIRWALATYVRLKAEGSGPQTGSTSEPSR